MVLYCVQHPANILRAIIHKFKYHDDEQAVILVEQNINSPHCPQIDNVKYYQMPSVHKIVTYSADSKEDVIQNMETQINMFLKEKNIILTDFNAIYALYDMYNPFTLYFELHGIDYMCIESFDKQFNLYWTGSCVKNRTKECYAYNCLIMDMHLQDGQGAHCVKGYLFSDKSVYPKGGSVPAEVFGYIETLMGLDARYKEQIVKAYDLNGYTFDSVLLFNSPGLTSKCIEDNKPDIPIKEIYDNVFFFYKVIIDYYFKNTDFILKLHPASGPNFINAFSNFKQIPAHIPVELFCLTGKKFKVICPLQSTSIDLFKQMNYEVVFFKSDLMRFFRLIHFVYNAFSLIKSVGIPEKIAVYGIDLNQLNYFKSWAYKDFINVRFEQLTNDNAKSAKYIIADPDDKFASITENAGNDSLIIVNGDIEPKNGFAGQKMICLLSDIAKPKRFEPQRSVWTLLSKNEQVLSVAKDFCLLRTLKNAEVKILSLPQTESVIVEDSQAVEKKPVQTAEDKGLVDHLMQSERKLLLYQKYMQMYYETERAGYSLRDYFEERGLLSPGMKLAFFATDELGVMVYSICERCGIKFSALVSDTDREITFKTHDNFTQSLKLQSLSKVDKSSYTNVFMASVWNGEQINFVKSFCPRLFLFDAVVQAMYTRAFFLNKIADIARKNPKVRVGIFSTPFTKQVPGEHSEIEELFTRQGSIPNVLNIKDEAMRERAKELCYKVYGFDDEYIENVCKASYSVVSYDGVYMFPDFKSKYANVVNHRRVTTDNPKNFTNTIYLFGDSCVTGLYVGDGETIASNLQRIINDNNLPYTVQNCANTLGGQYDRIFTLADTMKFKEGDILLFCARIDWLTEQYIKQNNKKLLNNILGIYTTSLFQRPHDYGEVFVGDHYFNGKGNSLIARKIFDEIKKEKFFEPVEKIPGETDEKKPAQTAEDKGLADPPKQRENILLAYLKILQKYYEAENAGYSLRDFFEERGLLEPNRKVAFFATDELGIVVYQICQRCGIKFSSLISNVDREITYIVSGNQTETLSFQAIDKVDKKYYTDVFMATVATMAENRAPIDFVKNFCPRVFIFDLAVDSSYTRAFFIDKIRKISDKNPGIKTAIFFTPFIRQLPGEHSELETFFDLNGAKANNICRIQDEHMREKAKELCYRKFGFQDDYIENVCGARYKLVSYNGVYMFPDFKSKYANVVNHRRVTTDNPKNFTNTIYLFGDSCVTGLYIGDGETIASNLQRIINDNNLPYTVQNCANTFARHYDRIFTLTDTMKFKAGDILLFCERIDRLTIQYIKQNNRTLLNNILGIDTTPLFQRPHDYGEVFIDDHHFNGKGNSLIAQKIFDEIKKEKFFEPVDENPGETAPDSDSTRSNNVEQDITKTEAGGQRA